MNFVEAKMSLGCPGRDMKQIYVSGVHREVVYLIVAYERHEGDV